MGALPLASMGPWSTICFTGISTATAARLPDDRCRSAKSRGNRFCFSPAALAAVTRRSTSRPLEPSQPTSKIIDSPDGETSSTYPLTTFDVDIAKASKVLDAPAAFAQTAKASSRSLTIFISRRARFPDAACPHRGRRQPLGHQDAIPSTSRSRHPTCRRKNVPVRYMFPHVAGEVLRVDDHVGLHWRHRAAMAPPVRRAVRSN